MVQTSTAQVIRLREETNSQLIARFLSRGIFASLMGLILFTAIPYGTTEAWWKAVFVCLVYLLAIGWIVEGLLTGSWRTGGRAVLMPVVALIGYSLLQTVPLGNLSSAGIATPFWNTISVDPYQTRFFVLQLSALTIVCGLFFRYTQSPKRVRILVYWILAVVVASALYGILRQTTQHEVGFGLPLIRPEQGYGQFVNRNHFAFLMEMGLGLALGLIVAGRVRREEALILFAALLPIWTGLVLANSRGGIFAMLAQVVIAALLFTSVTARTTQEELKLFKILRLWPVRIALISVLIAGVFFGTIWVGGDRLATRIEAISDEFDKTLAASNLGASRKQIWEATINMFAAHPVAGVGMGAYWIGITEYHDASGVSTPQEAHNDYLELLASGGLIAAALGGWFGFAVFKRIKRNVRSGDNFGRGAALAATLGISGVAVHSLVDFGLHMLANALIFTALIAIATSEKNGS